MKLASGSLVEAVVTIAAAGLMTFAGLTIVEELMVTSMGGTLAVARIVATPPPG